MSMFQRVPRSAAVRAFAVDVGVTGEAFEHGLDISSAYPGQRLDIPYEITVGETWRDIWQSNFFTPDRIFTSKAFAHRLGFKDTLMPPSLLTFMTGSMSHVDTNREVMDLGYRNAKYERPVYAGDTLSKAFRIKDLHEASSGIGTVITVDCEIYNVETNSRVFSVDKIMLYPDVKPAPNNLTSFNRFESSNTLSTVSGSGSSEILDQIIGHQRQLPTPRNLCPLRKSQLLLHNFARPIGMSNSINLNTLFRQTHPLLVNSHRYTHQEMVVAGGLVLAAAHACSASSLYEVLFEETIECSFYNKVSTLDTMSSMSYVVGIESLGSDLEEVTLSTIGLKNVDVARVLDGVELPMALFTSADGKTTHLGRKQLEALCNEHPSAAPLKDNIAMRSVRKIVRQVREQEDMFLL